MGGTRALIRNQLRLARRDPIPAVILLLMPMVLMAFLTPAMKLTLRAEGYGAATGSAQSVPGMVCVFSWFIVAFVGFALFREHGWQTWDRLRGSGLRPGQLLVGLLCVPAAMVALQHLLLFAFGALFLDLTITGSVAAVALVSAAFGLLVLLAGLAVAATFRTMPQVNAATNLGSMLLGGLGGGFVPVSLLPSWVRPLAPVSPTYWAMEGYRDVVLDGKGIEAVTRPVLVLLAFAAACGAVALWRLRFTPARDGWS